MKRVAFLTVLLCTLVACAQQSLVPTAPPPPSSAKPLIDSTTPPKDNVYVHLWDGMSATLYQFNSEYNIDTVTTQLKVMVTESGAVVIRVLPTGMYLKFQTAPAMDTILLATELK